MHTEVAALEEKVPAEQVLHTNIPVPVVYVPCRQVEQPADKAFAVYPALHGVHTVLSAEASVPGGHGSHLDEPAFGAIESPVHEGQSPKVCSINVDK